jgi:hypothetical protein
MRLSTRFLALGLAMVFAASVAVAQMAPIQYWRPYDQTGLNIFETTKDSGAAFNGLGVRIGGGFTQGYQVLSHENYATDTDGNLREGITSDADKANKLYTIGAGFNNASANLNIDAQLARGVRMNLVLYLSSRHHQETWVKGGFIQMDDLSFLGSSFLDDLMKYLTIRLGHMEINFGDSHFRRSDGGATIYNPFVENYIVDAFTTEIGGDIAFQSNGIIGVFGITNGEIKGNIVPLADSLGGATPAIYLKLGYDTKVDDDFRVRVTGSMYTQSQSPRNTLLWGDRTGSNYYMVMEKAMQNPTTASSTTAQAWSGRLNPNFANNITMFEFNAFLQLGGLEFFGTYNMGSGSSTPAQKASTLGDRSMNQLAADLLYRFGAARNIYVGARYNVANIELGNLDTAGEYAMSSSDRIAIAAGWYILDQMLLKGEYMMQNYNDFATGDYRNEGKINGFIIQAVVGF